MNTKYLRYALFIIYFWFGLLKVLNISPAEQVVEELLLTILPKANPDLFIPLFGLGECALAIGFLLPKFTKYVIPIAALHMVSTFLPLILLSDLTWHKMLVPTLEGQYIIKNVLILGSLYTIYTDWKKS